MIPAGAFLAAAVLTLLAIGADAAWHKLKHAGHTVGCAAVRAIGHKCAPPAKPKPAPLAWFTHDTDAEPARLLARKLELEAVLALAPTPELRAEYARVQREWGEAENAALGIR